MEYRRFKELLSKERLPAALVDLDAFDQNIAQIRDLLADHPEKTVRIATKSIRVPKLIRRILNSGLPFQGLMCYSAEEASFLASRGFNDLLVAYPTVQLSDLAPLRDLHNQGKLVRLVVDSSAGLQALHQVFSESASPFPVVVEMDASLRLLGNQFHFGVRRSPLRSVEDLSAFLAQLSKFSNLKFDGLMIYEAQVAGAQDRNPFRPIQNPLVRWIRKRSVSTVAKLRREVSEFLRKEGLSVRIFNGGGTGSLSYAVSEPSLTEITAGSALLGGHLFDYYSNISFEPALFYALQAVRTPEIGYITCQGGGYIASGSPGWDKTPISYLPKGLKWVSIEGAGEVQSPLRLPEGVEIAPGDPILFRHAKAGELAERFREYIGFQGGKFVGRMKTYRGFGRCFF